MSEPVLDKLPEGIYFKVDVPRRLTPMEIGNSACWLFMAALTTLPGDSVASSNAFQTLEWYGPESFLGIIFAVWGILGFVPSVGRVLARKTKYWMKAWRVLYLFISSILWLGLTCQCLAAVLLKQPITVGFGLAAGIGTGVGFATIDLWRRWRG